MGAVKSKKYEVLRGRLKGEIAHTKERAKRVLTGKEITTYTRYYEKKTHSQSKLFEEAGGNQITVTVRSVTVNIPYCRAGRIRPKAPIFLCSLIGGNCCSLVCH